jgi:hypothetical protein
MKQINDHYYPGCDSLEDIRSEKARLILKGKILETRIKIDMADIRESFSLSALAGALVKKYLPWDLTDLINRFIG